MFKKAIILAGGKGTRLRPYTISLPKPLVPVGEKPILEIIIEQLKGYGICEITIALNHFADIITAYFGKGEKWGVTIDYTYEEKPLSTMGPLRLVSELPNDFLVLNGDVLTDLNYESLYNFHLNNKAKFTICSYNRTEMIDYGVLIHDSKNRLTSFKEKPIYEFIVSMGIYAINKKVMKYIPRNTFFGFDHLMMKLLSVNIQPLLYMHNGSWLDIGRPSDYEKALQKMDTRI